MANDDVRTKALSSLDLKGNLKRFAVASPQKRAADAKASAVVEALNILMQLSRRVLALAIIALGLPSYTSALLIFW